MHRLSEDLLRIERQLGKAGLGKRYVILIYNVNILYIARVQCGHKLGNSFQRPLIYVCLLSQAYVQQLESSRIRLNQLEQELHRARAQVRKIKTQKKNPNLRVQLIRVLLYIYIGRILWWKCSYWRRTRPTHGYDQH